MQSVRCKGTSTQDFTHTCDLKRDAPNGLTDTDHGVWSPEGEGWGLQRVKGVKRLAMGGELTWGGECTM